VKTDIITRYNGFTRR